MTTQQDTVQGVRREAAPPRWAASPGELDDLEVLLLGGFGPGRVVGGSSGGATTGGTTAFPGVPGPVVPATTADEALAARSLLVLDEEGVARAEITVDGVRRRPEGGCEVRGRVRPYGSPVRGSHHELRRPADPPRPGGAPSPVLAVPLEAPLLAPEAAALRLAAASAGARLLLLPLTGEGRPRGIDGPGLVRATLGAAADLRSGDDGDAAVPVEVVPVALRRREPAALDRALVGRVAAAYGATLLPVPVAAGAALDPPPGVDVLVPPAVSLDGRCGRWGPAGGVPAALCGTWESDEVRDVVAARVRRGEPVPPELAHPAVVRELRRRTGPTAAGCAVLFTGLSGSGKSTIARGVAEALHERTDRAVTLLDGDVVRRMLSSELTFSRVHRELNVRRIGFVAAEISKHGGIALCAPIAPYAALRAEVRDLVEHQGGRFLLVYVATPLEVCEERDRKGLYARARAGEIAEFTGISDPYEPPLDADVVLDTSLMTIGEAVERVLAAGRARGWFPPAPTPIRATDDVQAGA